MCLTSFLFSFLFPYPFLFLQPLFVLFDLFFLFVRLIFFFLLFSLFFSSFLSSSPLLLSTGCTITFIYILSFNRGHFELPFFLYGVEIYPLKFSCRLSFQQTNWPLPCLPSLLRYCSHMTFDFNRSNVKLGLYGAFT